MNNVVNQVAYLRTSREFPQDISQLCLELSKSYIDTANAVNNRTISIFPTNRPAITGESWFINNNQRQQTLRQVYPITGTTNFNHGIDFTSVSTFTKIEGIAYDGATYYPIPYSSSNPAFNLGVFVNSTQVKFDAGASVVVVSGFILLEWLSNP